MCLNVYIGSRDRTLIVSTQEMSMSTSGKRWRYGAIGAFFSFFLNYAVLWHLVSETLTGTAVYDCDITKIHEEPRIATTRDRCRKKECEKHRALG